MIRTTTQLLYVVVAFSMAGAGCHGDEPLHAVPREFPITDGVVDTGHPNVGLLLIDAQGGVAKSICTATLVGKKTVLTAAHCCKPSVNILFQLGTKVHQVTKVIPHPSWTSLYKHDIGLAILKDPLTVGPAEAGTVSPTAGMKITLVGFGRTATNVKDSGKKRKASNTIAGVSSGYFTVTGSGSGVGNTCTGDSGGPVFTLVGGKEKMVGVISSSEQTCGVKSWHVTIKTYLSWLKSKAGGDFFPFPKPKLDGAVPKPDKAVPKPDAKAVQEVGVPEEAGVVPDGLYSDGPSFDAYVEPQPRGDDGCRVGLGRTAGVEGAAPLLLLALLWALRRRRVG